MSATTDRIMDHLRVKLPGAIDGVIQLEVYNTIDEICRTALQVASPDYTAAMDSWLTEAKWREYANLIQYGTLARAYASIGKPYSNAELAQANLVLFREQLEIIRTDAASDGAASLVALFMDALRVHLPGARDGVLQQETFFTVNELCRTAYIWREAVEIPLSLGSSLYTIPAPGEIVAVLFTEHLTVDLSASVTDPIQGLISLGVTPTAADLETPVFISMVLAPKAENPINLDALLPAHLWVQWIETIKDGVLGRMMSQPAKPYSNLQMATYHLRRFRNSMATARHLTNTGNVPGAQRWCFPKWA